MVWESLQWRTELRYRYACLTVEGRGYSHVQARWLLMVRHVLTDDEKSCMLLVMRTLSIVPLNFKVCVLCALCQVRSHSNNGLK
jgi:hypothetical protein